MLESRIKVLETQNEPQDQQNDTKIFAIVQKEISHNAQAFSSNLAELRKELDVQMKKISEFDAEIASMNKKIQEKFERSISTLEARVATLESPVPSPAIPD